MRKSKTKRPTFALAGLGFISDRHRDAIKHIGGEVIAGCDNDADIGFTDIPLYRNYDDMLDNVKADYIVICTPNYLHVPMICKALQRTKSQIICEKPVILDKRDIHLIRDDRVNCLMQLRYVDVPKLNSGKNTGYMDIYINRGDWYFEGWKGDEKKSGGLLFNIGVHYFDLLERIFGPVGCSRTTYRDDKYAFGNIRFAWGDVNWSIDLTAPEDNQRRVIMVNDKKLEFTKGIKELHKKAYEEIIAGRGIKPAQIYDVTCLIERFNKGD